LSNVEINSILDSASGKRLAECPFLKKVLFNRSSSLDVVHFWNMCSMDNEHCDFHGRKLRFKPCFSGVRVCWLCPKLVGLPNEEI